MSHLECDFRHTLIATMNSNVLRAWTSLRVGFMDNEFRGTHDEGNSHNNTTIGVAFASALNTTAGGRRSSQWHPSR